METGRRVLAVCVWCCELARRRWVLVLAARAADTGRRRVAGARCARGADWALVPGAGAGCARTKTRHAVLRVKIGAAANAGRSPEKSFARFCYLGSMLE